ncbi:MAG: asparagine synthase (glutamine-hydrolyzing) [Gemmatimonadales bacterium]|nr:MAG: asparagine synthase (glutamine-hydrolyzing) [Gemmatimonadales bacterium]
MCGICGRISGAPIDPDVIRGMTRTLAHRGPDDEGIRIGEGFGLGHRRLSIIDLEGGAQPMSTPDGLVWIVFNGEIYNYGPLRQELLNAGFAFRTRSDTETILNCYLRDGTDCLRHLRGMFSLAIWDGRSRRLFAARDRLGQKPFYYSHRPGEFLFGSEIKALLHAEPGLAELDLQALDEYLTLRIVASPRSMFRGIRKLPPAHFLTFSAAEGLHVERYWDLAYEPKLKGDDEELLEELERRIVEAIRVHLVSDVPVGAFLSGGLDSTLVVALLMKHRLVDQLRTFSVSLPLAEFDEAPLARLVAERYGTLHRQEQIVPSLIHDLPGLVRQLDEPSDALASCMDLVAGMARRDVKVVLGGDGGDELFGGYDRYFGNRMADRYASIPGWIRRKVIGPALSVLPDGRWYKSRGHQLKWLHRLAEHSGGERYVQGLAYFYFHQSFKDRVYGARLRNGVTREGAGATMKAAFDGAPASDLVDRMLYADLQARLPDHPVMIQDRMTMAHGLEARSPLMDHELAEFAARLPPRMKVRGRRLRYAQTELARRVLPPPLLERRKQGFASALPYLLRDELDILQRTFLPTSRLAREGLLDQGGVSALLGEHRRGVADHGSRLWLLVNAEVWFRIFMEGASDGELRESIARTASDRSVAGTSLA